MRLLVLSDSHGSVDRMSLAARRSKPDAILHLGDHIGDARKLYVQFPDVAFYMVKGNCDANAAGETEQLFTLDGVRIFMTHGHKYNIKNGLAAFVNRAQATDARIALYGHTHIARILQTEDVWLMNPGQMVRHDSKHHASYGIITLVKGRLDMEIVYLSLKQ